MDNETDKMIELARDMDRVVSTWTRSTLRSKRIELARLMVAMSKEIDRVAPIILSQMEDESLYHEETPSPLAQLSKMVGE